MRFSILRAIYNSLPLSSFKPKSLKYSANCRKLEQLHISLQATLNPEQINAVEEYISLIDQQALAEQQQSFVRGVQVGVRFMREAQSPFKKGEI